MFKKFSKINSLEKNLKEKRDLYDDAVKARNNLIQSLKDKEMDRNMREAWDRFYGKEKSEEDVETFSGGGIIRGTRAQTSGRRFSGVY